jgi:glutamyl-tRNA synthetase
MIEHFDIQRVSLGGPIFDVEKLRWLNGLWLREDCSPEQLADRLQEWALNRDMLMKLVPHLQSRIEVFSDMAPLAAFFLSGMLPLTPESFAASNLDEDELLTLLQCSAWRLESLNDWSRDRIFAEIKSLADGLGIKLKDFMPPLFIAVAGTTSSISVVDSMEVLGPDMSRARLRHAVEVLGGVGKKKLKKLEKRYHEACAAQ